MFRTVVVILLIATAFAPAPVVQTTPVGPPPEPAPQGITLSAENVFLCVKLTVTVPSDGSHHTWVTVDWGDGTVDPWMDIACVMGCTGRFSHAYTAPGSYTITGTHHADGAVNSTSVEVTASPEFSLYAYAQGENWIQLASFDSLYTDHAYEATVDWGDGTEIETFEWRACDGGPKCAPLHDYTAAGEYSIVAWMDYLDCCGNPCYQRVASLQATIGEPSAVRQSTWGAIKALFGD